jgi:hypothetical protein
MIKLKRIAASTVLAVLVASVIGGNKAYCSDEYTVCEYNNFYCRQYNNYIEITGYDGDDTNIKIPSILNNLPVKSIGLDAFNTKANIKSISIPSTVISIGNGAFWNCTSLETIKIPDGITKISAGTFCNCYNLKEIEIPYSVTNIDVNSFTACSSLSSIKINNPNCTIFDSSDTITNGDADNYLKYSGTIYGYSNSTVQSYANKYSLNFNSIVKTQGDANCDEQVSIRDAAYIAKKLAQQKNDQIPIWADFNEDGKVNVRDASKIAKYLSVFS